MCIRDRGADDAGDHADCMALSEGALKQISECDGASQLAQRLWVVKVFHLMGVLVEQCSGIDRLGNVAQKPPLWGPLFSLQLERF